MSLKFGKPVSSEKIVTCFINKGKPVCDVTNDHVTNTDRNLLEDLLACFSKIILKKLIQISKE